MSKTIIIENPTGFDRAGWVEVVIPEDLGANARFDSGSLIKWPAVRGKQRFPGAWVYRIKVTLRGEQRISGTLVADAAPPGLPLQFQPHPWVADDPTALVPDPVYQGPGTVRLNWSFMPGNGIVDSSVAHQTVKISRNERNEGLIFECFLRLLENDPCVEVYGAFIWSTRRDPALVKRGTLLVLRTLELFQLDFATSLGASPPYHLDQWYTTLRQSPAWQDGSAYAFTGRMLCFVGPTTSMLAEDPEEWALSVSSLKAGQVYPMIAVCTEWAGAQLPALQIPRVRSGGTTAAAQALTDWNAFVTLQNRAGDWHAARQIGLVPDPTISGDQEDFSYTKGIDAIVGIDPKWILQSRYAAYAEFLRGGMNYEDKIGNSIHLLTNAEHPNWHCWAGYTHFNVPKSPDRIGKNNEAYGERASANGWIMEDDQHHSRVNRNAYRMLCDDPLWDLRDESIATIDSSAERDEAPRAYGRLLQTWADQAAVAPSAQAARYTALAAARIAAAAVKPEMLVPGTMKVLQVQPPASSIEIYSPVSPFGRANAATMWQHAIAAIGFHRWSGTNATALAVRNTLLNTLCVWGCWMDPGDNTWYMVDNIWYAGGGAGPNAAQFVNGSPQVVMGKGGSVGGTGYGGTVDWTFVGLLMAAKYLGAGANRTKAATAVAWWTGNQEANVKRVQEWWAAVDAIPVVP